MKTVSAIIVLMSLLLIQESMIQESMIQERKPISIIYPGEGFGNVMLGDTSQDVIAKLGWGEPEEFRKNEQQKEYYLIYESKGVTLIFKKDEKSTLKESKLHKIIFWNPIFTVVDIGIKVGDSRKILEMRRSRLSSAYIAKKGDEIDTINYYDSGITYSVYKTGIIKAIEIFSIPRENLYIIIKSLEVKESGDITNDDAEIYFKIYVNGDEIKIPELTTRTRYFKISDNSKKPLGYKFQVPNIDLKFEKFELKVEAWDWNRDARDDKIGDFTVRFKKDQIGASTGLIESKKLRIYDSKIELELVAE